MFNIFKKNNGGSKDIKVNSPLEGVAGLLQFMIERLVDNPNDVKVREIEGERSTILELKVNEDDMGKVIGKKGRIIKSLRIVVRAAAVREEKNISIELVK